MQHHLLRKKLAKSFAARKKIGFWSVVRRLNGPPSSRVPVVDNVSDPFEIANLFATNISNLLNTHSPLLFVTPCMPPSDPPYQLVSSRILRYQMMISFKLYTF